MLLYITEISHATRDTIVRELTKKVTVSPEPPLFIVSPVATPYISRPSTCADSLRMTGDDVLFKIINGNMHLNYAMFTKQIKIFVHSDFTGNTYRYSN